MDHVKRFIEEAKYILDHLDHDALARMAAGIAAVRERGGRLFFLGSGGGAGHASHAVNDFRKIAGIECYSPSDNVSELTARVNDEGWDGAYAAWLRTSRIGPRDGVFVFSVGGGSVERNISVNLVQAVQLAKSVEAAVFCVVGRDGGFAAKVADHSIIVPSVNKDLVTPQVEGFQAVVWHLLVSHPMLQKNETKWESTQPVFTP